GASRDVQIASPALEHALQMVVHRRSRRHSFSRLRQGDPQEFLDGGGAVDDLEEAGLAEGLHALALGDLAELRGRGVPEGEVADFGGDGHDLVDGDAAPHAGEVAGGAALAAVEGAGAEALGEVAVGGEAVLVGLVGLAAVLADAAGEALGDDEEEGGGYEEGGDAH